RFGCASAARPCIASRRSSASQSRSRPKRPASPRAPSSKRVRVRLAVAAGWAGVLVAGVAAASPGPEIDVSNLEGPQTNATIAIDPRNDHVLLAASNSLVEGTERLYGSTDSGATWQSSTAFPPTRNVKV